MISLTLETEPTAVAAHCQGDQLIVVFADGRTLSTPLSWYPRLAYATPGERQNMILLGDGYALEWPDLDEHIGIEGLLAGRRSGESKASLERWLASRPRGAGSDA